MGLEEELEEEEKKEVKEMKILIQLAEYLFTTTVSHSVGSFCPSIFKGFFLFIFVNLAVVQVLHDCNKSSALL